MEVLKTALSSIDVRRSLFDNGTGSAEAFLQVLRENDKQELKEQTV